MKTIRIKDLDKYGVLAQDLIDIISVCGAKYQDRVWIAYGIECMESSWTERFGTAQNNQLEMSYRELNDYATSVHQTIDGVFFALKKDNSYDGKKIEYKNIREISDFIIEFVDSGFIDVTSDDNECLQRLKTKFSDVSFVDEKDATLQM